MATTKRGGGDDGSKTTGRKGPRIHSSHDGASGRPGRPALPANVQKRVGPPKAPRPPKLQKPLTPTVGTSAGMGPRTKKARTPNLAGASTSVASDQSRALAVAIAVAGIEKKAVGLEILDVAGKVDYADFLALMTGRSDRQVSALAQGIDEALRKKNRRPLSVEGQHQASWILMDYGDVVVHVFQDDARSLYDIDGLWLDARRIPIPVPEGRTDGPIRD